jgi:hypothetical protein
VEYSADIGDAAPTSGKSPDIEASVISEQIITFLSKDTAEPDTTIIVEGPLVTKEGAINFNRDRGLANDYPAHVVKYNSLYLVSSTDAVLPGVSTVDISWVIGE